jgi:hypothetical protein
MILSNPVLLIPFLPHSPPSRSLFPHYSSLTYHSTPRLHYTSLLYTSLQPSPVSVQRRALRSARPRSTQPFPLSRLDYYDYEYDYNYNYLQYIQLPYSPFTSQTPTLLIPGPLGLYHLLLPDKAAFPLPKRRRPSLVKAEALCPSVTVYPASIACVAIASLASSRARDSSKQTTPKKVASLP